MLSNWLREGLGRVRSLLPRQQSVVTHQLREDTLSNEPLIDESLPRDASEDDLRELDPRRPVHSDNERDNELSGGNHQPARPKRGRGRPAFRPFDLPSSRPLKRRSGEPASDSSEGNAKAHLA